MKQLILIISLSTSLLCLSQSKKTYEITRTNTPPTIDGILDEEIWNNLQLATDFIQFEPDIGHTPEKEKRSEVKMTYDDNAIYISAYLYDNPDDMMQQITQRDNFGQADFFGIVFNPNNDAQNNTEFFVFSSGAQADAVEAPGVGEDFDWNAVWDSAVKTMDNGWTLEVKIPYRALRFTQQENPTWGIQFHRHYRKTRKQYSWNAIDVTKGNAGIYNAELKGLKNIKPPTRLSFYPYASALVTNFEGNTDTDFAAGLDLKYGITESFTLDATLIPDFSQVGFDNVELNLGPFEQRFAERRQFFTEGVDLFNKGRLFYSRRIGGRPSYTPDLEDNEEFIDYPNKVQLINAIKVSGRTRKGLGVGFFNAITKEAYTTIETTDILNEDTPDEEIIKTRRKELVEPLANYNILVLDQQFNKNSSVTLINTNVTRDGNFRDSNVTGFLFDINDKKNTFGSEGEVKMSSFNDVDNKPNGYSAKLETGKNSGNFQYSLEYSYADENFDINDMGIQFRNNYSNFGADVSYRIFEPTKTLNSLRVNSWLAYNKLSNPNTFIGSNTGFRIQGTTKKLYYFNFKIGWDIGNSYDYFEPRDDFNSFFVTKNLAESEILVSSNFNKFFSYNANFGYGLFFDKERDNFNNWSFGFSPRFKFNDKFLLVLGLEYDNYTADRGYINNQEVEDKIIFGQRDIIETETSISGSYTFNPFNAITLSFRNYLSRVTYDNQVYNLQDDGTLKESEVHTKYTIGSDSDFNPDVNFNTWNLDLSYSWQFAPGSFLTALYRNQIFDFSENSNASYTESIKNLFEQEKRNTFSLRLVYFLDYNNIKQAMHNKSKS